MLSMGPEPLPQRLVFYVRAGSYALMPIIITESAKVGPLFAPVLVKHPVSCCWSYNHRCLTTSVYGS